jgi:DNA-binding transcriptional LysR family regulator
MELEWLRRFVVVAETLNFRRAALQLGISQPALSRSLHLLEEAIGSQLLERDRRGVSLTVAGRVLREESPRLLEHADMVQRVTQHSTESNRLSVGFLTMALYRALPDALKEFRRRWPGVDLHLHELSSLEQYQRLENGTLDIGIIAFESTDQHIMATRVIDRSPVVLVVPEAWELARRKSIALSELANLPLIQARRNTSVSMRDILDLKCREAGFAPNIVHEANQIYPILKLAAAGEGIGFVPEIAKVHPVKGVRYIPVKDESWNVELQLGMMWVERTLPAAMKNFIACVTEVTAANSKKRGRPAARL